MQALIDSVLHSSQIRVLIFGAVVAIIWYFYHRATKHIRLERQLPTSKVGSVTVGLAEIRGKTQAMTTCISPATNTECIAYYYEKQKKRIEDGRTKTIVLAKKTDVMPFDIVDETGRVSIDLNDLDMKKIPVTYSYDRGAGITHKEVILKNGLDVLLIGRATPQDGKIVMRKDEAHDVFNLTSYSGVKVARRLAPMFRILGIYTLLTLVLIAFIISA